jgi:predicted enzyme related to lactoylglutathione lyase
MTTANADEVSAFYMAVAGWKREAVKVDDYFDFSMMAPDGSPAAGICHKRGANAELPGGWMVYIVVADLAASLAAVAAHGGAVMKPATGMGPTGSYAVIRDPGGSTCALFQPPPAA